MKDQLIYDNEKHKAWMESRRIPPIKAAYQEMQERDAIIEKLSELLIREGYEWKSLDGNHFDWYKRR